MDILDLEESFLTGVESIDREHLELVVKIKELIDAINHGQERFVIEDTIAFLLQHVRIHFKAEEAFYYDRKIPGMEEHQQDHIRITKALDHALIRYREEGLTPSMELELLNQTIRGFIDHVRRFDTQLALYIMEQPKK